MRYKKIDKNATVFYVFEISSTTFSIFDGELDLPVYHGSWNMCEGIIKNIKKHMKEVTIFYYTKDKSGSLVMSPLWSYKA